MVLIPETDSTISRIYGGYVARNKASSIRLHLGASEIGKECERQIWYGFRWIKEQDFPGQLLRLFDTGKLEENRFISDLGSIGVEVRPFDLKTGRQYRMDMFGGHFGGSLDGLVLGIVEAPKTWHGLEMKTHNDKSFKSLCDKGVKIAKPEHFTQMNTYMGMSHETPLEGIPPLTRFFYLAVNKNNDELYAERVYYDPAAYLATVEKARRIVFSDAPPARISMEHDFWQCRFCNYKTNCHGKNKEGLPVFEQPNKNCRTCIHSTAHGDGTWRCEKWNKVLGVNEQKAGCEKHLYLPSLFPTYKQMDVTEHSVIYNDREGNEFTNFEGGEVSKTNG